jgi:hypothetical protein
MYILHLIMKNCCKHSVFVEENNRLEAIPTAIAHLKKEAGGQEAEVIVCNSENMPIEFHTIIGSDGIPIKNENPWLWMAIGTIIAATICWQLIS